MPLNHTGLFIIRAWVELVWSIHLRAQILLTSVVAAGFASELTLVDVLAVSEAVESWLQDVLLDGERP
jgi:hypothetical protein